MLGPDDVLPGVADIVTEVAVEAVFDDGSRLVVVPDPVGGGHLGDARPGAVLQAGTPDAAAPQSDVVEVGVVNTAPVPGERQQPLPLLRGQPPAALRPGGRPTAARLDLPAGATVRFDPGAEVAVRLVPFGGNRVVVGFSGLVDGPLDAPGAREAALERAKVFGYSTTRRERGSDGTPAPGRGRRPARATG